MTTKEIETVGTTDIANLNTEAAEAMKRLFAQSLKKTVNANQFPTIVMQHGVKKPKFEIGDEELTEFLAGIANFTTGREYYPSEDVKIPECTSIGGTNGTLYGTCAKCGFHQWGTGKNGKGRACKEYRRLLLQVKDKEGILELKIPATSLAVFDTLQKQIQEKEGMPLQKYVYKFKLDVGEAQGRKPWAIINIAKECGIEAAGEEFTARILNAIVEYEKSYAPTALVENASKPSEMPKAPELIPATPTAAGVVVEEDDGCPF